MLSRIPLVSKQVERNILIPLSLGERGPAPPTPSPLLSIPLGRSGLPQLSSSYYSIILHFTSLLRPNIMIMMMIGSHRIMITKLIRYYNGLVLLFVWMGRPRSPGAEARGRGLSSSSSSTMWVGQSNVRCGRWPLSSRPASTTTTRVHVLEIDLLPLPHRHRRHHLLLLYLLPLLHPLHHCPASLSSYALWPAFATAILGRRRGGGGCCRC